MVVVVVVVVVVGTWVSQDVFWLPEGERVAGVSWRLQKAGVGAQA